MTAAMTSPLQGLTVVSIEQAVAAPLCTARLQQAGARVIKIERDGGDFARRYDAAANGESSYFTWLNQGKESLVMDFKQAEDAALLRRIIANADVLVQNLSPGALSRSGFGLETLREQHPRLITCDISGYGNSPAVADLKAYDLLVQAEAGLISISGSPLEPGRIGISICDIGAGMTAHAGVLEALLARSIHGQGSAVEVSLFDVAAEWMSVPWTHEKYGNGAPARVGLHHPSIAPYGAYATRDQELTLVSIQNEREWLRFCQVVLDDESIATDARFDTNDHRVANRPALDACIDARLSQLDASEYRQLLAKAELAYGAINTVTELLQHRAIKTVEMRNSEGLALTLPRHSLAAACVPANSTSASAQRSPRIGEHSDSLRAEFANQS